MEREGEIMEWKLRGRKTGWHKWFALIPVPVGDNQYAWMQYVERRFVQHPANLDTLIEYRRVQS